MDELDEMENSERERLDDWKCLLLAARYPRFSTDGQTALNNNLESALRRGAGGQAGARADSGGDLRPLPRRNRQARSSRHAEQDRSGPPRLCL